MTSFRVLGLVAMLLAGLAPLAAIASADAPLDAWSGAATEWFAGVNASEAQLRTALVRGRIEASDCDATIGQIRAGSASLRTLLAATVVSDTMLRGPLMASPPPQRSTGQWGNRFIRATSVVAISANVTQMVIGWREGSVVTRQRLGVTSAVVGSAGALFSLLRPRPKPQPVIDPVDRSRTVIREMLLRDTFAETGRQVRELMNELDAIHDDSAETYGDKILLVRRYAGAIERTSALLDIEVPHASTTARTASTYSSFNDDARGRLSLLADHLDLIGAEWRTWRWLAGRSQRDALGFLAMVETAGERGAGAGGGSSQAASTRP